MLKKLLIACLFLISLFISNAQDTSLIMWYAQPASRWEEALPLGNGRLGAMVFGGVQRERIQLNEESLWAGKRFDNNNPKAFEHLRDIQELLLKGENKTAHELARKYMVGTPTDFRSYQTLGDIYLDFGFQGSTKHYKRSLDLHRGVAETSYEINGIRFNRKIFASTSDNVIVIWITADKNSALSGKITLSRLKDASITADGNTITMNGQIVDVTDSLTGEGGLNMKFHAIVKVDAYGGGTQTAGNSVLVESADSIRIILSAATDYHLPKLQFDRSINSLDTAKKLLHQAEQYASSELLNRHIHTFSKEFGKFNLRLGNADKLHIATDKRLQAFKNGESDHQLFALYAQFGRYLLLSSSGFFAKLPANLQGIWNEHYDAPWGSDYHTNINLQMNYWPVDVTNLSSAIQPLLNFIDRYRIPGRITARKMYGAKGWTMHHATDIFGKTGIISGIHWGTSPLAGAWLTTHFWEHYLFNPDNAFLRHVAYPVMKEAVEFVQDFLIEGPNGYLVTSPSMSPENAFYLPDGTAEQLTYAPAMDIQIIRELYKGTIQAAKILKEDKRLIEILEATLKRLPPTKISSKTGIIMEWIEDYDEVEKGHRHISQLYALYPGSQISRETPDLFKAADATIARRLTYGGGHTGWSRAWIINFYARLMKGNDAFEHIKLLLQKSTLPNLFDDHPPFQIDGNFGGTAGIAEMLLQSHNGIEILPALPEAWKEGEVKGIKARGGFELSFSWENGKLKDLLVLSKYGGECVLRYKEKTVIINTEKGKIYTPVENFRY